MNEILTNEMDLSFMKKFNETWANTFARMAKVFHNFAMSFAPAGSNC
jgi:hypothetical protein